MSASQFRALYAEPDRLDQARRKFDRLSVVGLSALAPGAPATVWLKKNAGRVEEIRGNHTLTHEQIAWFRTGSALNAAQASTGGSR